VADAALDDLGAHTDRARSPPICRSCSRPSSSSQSQHCQSIRPQPAMNLFYSLDFLEGGQGGQTFPRRGGVLATFWGDDHPRRISGPLAIRVRRAHR
jgi:hypothetical protein